MKFALMAVVGVLATGCAMGGPTQDRAYKKTTRDPQVISVLTGPSSLVQDDTTVGRQTLLDKPGFGMFADGHLLSGSSLRLGSASLEVIYRS